MVRTHVLPELLPKGRAPASPAADLAALERLAWLMDQSLGIPGTRFRVGLDALLGLLPGFGDALGSFLQLGVIGFSIYRYRLPKVVVARMIANALIDAGLGVVPIVGDVADAGFKAHSRNLRLLRESLEHRTLGREVPTAPSRRFLVGVLSVLALAGVGLIALMAGFIYLLVRMIV